MESRATQLLHRVRRRQTLRSLGRRAAVASLALLAVYGASFLAARPLGLLPDWDHRVAIALPLLAVLAALVTTRRPTERDAARAVDRALDSDDLFLTRASLDPGPGAFAELVGADAEARALSASPAAIVPFAPLRPALAVVAAAAALAVAITLVPAGDPFGLRTERAERAAQDARLADLAKATAERLEALRAADPKLELSREIQAALEDLQKTFAGMRPDAKEQNRAQLDRERRELGETWRAAREDAAARSDATVPMQSFGDAEKRRQWQTSLASGSAEDLQRELREIRDELEAANEAGDPTERARHRDAAERRLRELAQFARQKLGSDPLGEALSRALEQMKQLDRDGASPLDPKSLRESLELSELEMDRVAQALRDMQKLEAALRACEKAAAANEQNALDGADCEGCGSLEDYERLYERLCARGGDGTGPGQSGSGRGEGVAAAEDESQKTAFHAEKSPSELTAGRVLMELDDRGVGDAGERSEEFAAQVEVLRQRASEAIQKEEVPPGYHAPIRRYFDALRRGEGR